MDWVHEGVHGLGPQGWSTDRGSMFCMHPSVARKQSSLNLINQDLTTMLIRSPVCINFAKVINLKNQAASALTFQET